MNKNKKGFISMTLVYTFLVIFLFLMLAILNTYMQKDKFMEAIDTKIDEDISKSQGVRSSVINKVLEYNTPSPASHFNPINIANKSFSNGNGLFYTDDLSITDENGDGASNRIYFFRGQIDVNHLVFANMCWRIVRTNEDGTIRIMYNGPFQNNKCMSTDEVVEVAKNTGKSPRSIQSVQFNSSDDSANYTGYVYKTGSETLNADDVNPQSIVKRVLEDWYRNNIVDKINPNTSTSYSNSVSPAIYCNDRTYLAKSITPVFKNNQDHNIYNVDNIKNQVTLRCPGTKNSNGIYTRDDRFNVVDNINGNQLLFYPVGLITAQEVALAGGYLTSENDLYNGGYNGMINEGYYMFTKTNYWTMTPYGFDNNVAKIVYVNNEGTMMADSVKKSYDIIPVISLRANVSISEGTGTNENPFKVR